MQAGGSTPARLPTPSPTRQRLGRDLDSDRILASVMTFQIALFLTCSHTFFVPRLARRSPGSRAFLGLGRPWRPCSVLTAIGSPRSPKQIRGRLWEPPRGITVGGHCARLLALRQAASSQGVVCDVPKQPRFSLVGMTQMKKAEADVNCWRDSSSVCFI